VVAAARILLRSCRARPSKRLDIQPTETAAILEEAIDAAPLGDIPFPDRRIAAGWFHEPAKLVTVRIDSAGGMPP
jgi:hypothetical protein